MRERIKCCASHREKHQFGRCTDVFPAGRGSWTTHRPAAWTWGRFCSPTSATPSRCAHPVRETCSSVTDTCWPTRRWRLTGRSGPNWSRYHSAKIKSSLQNILFTSFESSKSQGINCWFKKTNLNVMLCVCRVKCCKPEEEDAPSCSLTSRRWNRKSPRCKDSAFKVDLRGKKTNLIIDHKLYLWHITMNQINRRLVMWMFLDVSTAVLKKKTWAKNVLPSLPSLFHNTPNNIWSIIVHVVVLLFGSQS